VLEGVGWAEIGGVEEGEEGLMGEGRGMGRGWEGRGEMGWDEGSSTNGKAGGR
jgi:hypothetical protein